MVSQWTPSNHERIGAVMSKSEFVLMLASWAGYFWLGFQFGKGWSALQRKLELEELEHRFKIVNSEAIDVPKQRRPAA